jgi:hypothetical protein
MTPSTDGNSPLTVTFASFVVGLATSAMSAMGEGPSTSEVDLQLARNTIDVLAVLKEKTEGNLDTDEVKLLDAILYDTRMRFVKHSGEPSSED